MARVVSCCFVFTLAPQLAQAEWCAKWNPPGTNPYVCETKDDGGCPCQINAGGLCEKSECGKEVTDCASADGMLACGHIDGCVWDFGTCKPKVCSDNKFESDCPDTSCVWDGFKCTVPPRCVPVKRIREMKGTGRDHDFALWVQRCKSLNSDRCSSGEPWPHSSGTPSRCEMTTSGDVMEDSSRLWSASFSTGSPSRNLAHFVGAPIAVLGLLAFVGALTARRSSNNPRAAELANLVVDGPSAE